MITELEKDAWPQKDLEAVPVCPVCGSSARSPLYEKLEDHLFGASGRWTLHHCTQCRSAYLDPRPTPSSIGRAYSSYYTHESSEVPTGLVKYLSRSARNGYINQRWKTLLTPYSSLLGRMVGWSPSLKAKVDHELMRSLPRSNNGDHLLDVGCGNGQFLSFMKAAGWNVKGVDFDAKAVAAARERGLDVVVGGLEIFSNQAETYDVITLSHVIEHVYNPLDTLLHCFRLLRSGGTLWIETPNLASSGHKLFRRHWRGLEPPRHLMLFNWTSLTSVLERAGFIDIQPAEWRPQFRPLAEASQHIRKCEIPDSKFNPHESIKRTSAQCEASARARAETREFVTLLATKP